jgi:hypothetical protein
MLINWVTLKVKEEWLTSLSEVLSPFRGSRLCEWFSDLTELWHDTAPIKPNDIASPHGLTQWIHYKNFFVWHFEEQVRHEGVKDKEIVELEQKIDRHNLKRLEAIEQIDIWIDNVLNSAGIRPDKDIDVNSETPGSIVDRLSILTLKIFHLNELLLNERLNEEQRQLPALRKSILEEQRSDLAGAMDKLLLDLRQAKKRHQVYRQYKIYNDPSFHPEQYNHV